MASKLTTDEIQRLIQLAQKTQFDYKLHLYENDALKNLNKSVRKTQSIISAKLKTIKPESTFSVEKMNALSDEMERLTAGVQAQITKGIADTTFTAGMASYAEHNKIASFGGLVPGFNNVALSPFQMTSLVSGTKIGGKKLNEWVEHNFSKRLQDDFKAKITNGMLMGQSYPEMIKQFNSGVYDQFSGDIESLTRTYVQSVNVNAMHDVAKANDDIIKGWKWNSVAENRTCIRCLSLDSQNTLYKIGEGPDMPLHQNCRCFPEYITKTFRELGVDIDEMEDSYRPYSIRGTVDPITGKINPGKIGVGGGKIISTGRFLGTYDDFFKGLPADVQTKMLGPTRYGLWKSGKLKLADMTDKAGNTILIKDLGKVKSVKKTVKEASKVVESTSLRESLKKAESEMALRKTEKAYVFDTNGNKVFSKKGDKSSVSFTQKEVNSMAGNINTHNHPGGTSFSFDDINVLLQADLKEIRAVTKSYVHSFSLSPGAPVKDAALSILEKEYKKANETVLKGLVDRVQKKEISVKYADFLHKHLVWEKVSNDIDWVNYNRTSWAKIRYKSGGK